MERVTSYAEGPFWKPGVGGEVDGQQRGHRSLYTASVTHLLVTTALVIGVGALVGLFLINRKTLKKLSLI